MRYGGRLGSTSPEHQRDPRSRLANQPGRRILRRGGAGSYRRGNRIVLRRRHDPRLAFAFAAITGGVLLLRARSHQ